MKILTWNCNGAFRKKYKELLLLDADILIIQECEDPEQSKDIEYKQWANNYFWTGDSKNKGLAIFAKPNIQIELLAWSNQFEDHFVKHFLPVKVNGIFEILGIWTHQNNSPTFGYIGQIWKYLKTNQSNFNNTFLIGDWNSNVIWDKWDRWWNHSNVVHSLREQKIVSYYHEFFKEDQGKETQPTFYLQRNLKKSYHIDFIFGPERYLKKIQNFHLGEVSKWLQISDHIPVLIDINLENH